MLEQFRSNKSLGFAMAKMKKDNFFSIFVFCIVFLKLTSRSFSVDASNTTEVKRGNPLRIILSLAVKSTDIDPKKADGNHYRNLNNFDIISSDDHEIKSNSIDNNLNRDQFKKSSLKTFSVPNYGENHNYPNYYDYGEMNPYSPNRINNYKKVLNSPNFENTHRKNMADYDSIFDDYFYENPGNERKHAFGIRKRRYVEKDSENHQSDAQKTDFIDRVNDQDPVSKNHSSFNQNKTDILDTNERAFNKTQLGEWISLVVNPTSDIKMYNYNIQSDKNDQENSDLEKMASNQSSNEGREKESTITVEKINVVRFKLPANRNETYRRQGPLVLLINDPNSHKNIASQNGSQESTDLLLDSDIILQRHPKVINDYVINDKEASNSQNNKENMKVHKLHALGGEEFKDQTFSMWDEHRPKSDTHLYRVRLLGNYGFHPFVNLRTRTEKGFKVEKHHENNLAENPDTKSETDLESIKQSETNPPKGEQPIVQRKIIRKRSMFDYSMIPRKSNKSMGLYRNVEDYLNPYGGENYPYLNLYNNAETGIGNNFDGYRNRNYMAGYRGWNEYDDNPYYDTYMNRYMGNNAQYNRHQLGNRFGITDYEPYNVENRKYYDADASRLNEIGVNKHYQRQDSYGQRRTEYGDGNHNNYESSNSKGRTSNLYKRSSDDTDLLPTVHPKKDAFNAGKLTDSKGKMWFKKGKNEKTQLTSTRHMSYLSGAGVYRNGVFNYPHKKSSLISRVVPYRSQGDDYDAVEYLNPFETYGYNRMRDSQDIGRTYREGPYSNARELKTGATKRKASGKNNYYTVTGLSGLGSDVDIALLNKNIYGKNWNPPRYAYPDIRQSFPRDSWFYAPEYEQRTRISKHFPTGLNPFYSGKNWRLSRVSHFEVPRSGKSWSYTPEKETNAYSGRINKLSDITEIDSAMGSAGLDQRNLNQNSSIARITYHGYTNESVPDLSKIETDKQSKRINEQFNVLLIETDKKKPESNPNTFGTDTSPAKSKDDIDTLKKFKNLQDESSSGKNNRFRTYNGKSNKDENQEGPSYQSIGLKSSLSSHYFRSPYQEVKDNFIGNIDYGNQGYPLSRRLLMYDEEEEPLDESAYGSREAPNLDVNGGYGGDFRNVPVEADFRSGSVEDYENKVYPQSRHLLMYDEEEEPYESDYASREEQNMDLNDGYGGNFQGNPDEGDFRNNPDEGDFRNNPDEGDFRNSPNEGAFRNVPVGDDEDEMPSDTYDDSYRQDYGEEMLDGDDYGYKGDDNNVNNPSQPGVQNYSPADENGDQNISPQYDPTAALNQEPNDGTSARKFLGKIYPQSAVNYRYSDDIYNQNYSPNRYSLDGQNRLPTDVQRIRDYPQGRETRRLHKRSDFTDVQRVMDHPLGTETRRLHERSEFTDVQRFKDHPQGGETRRLHERSEFTDLDSYPPAPKYGNAQNFEPYPPMLYHRNTQNFQPYLPAHRSGEAHNFEPYPPGYMDGNTQNFDPPGPMNDFEPNSSGPINENPQNLDSYPPMRMNENPQNEPFFHQGFQGDYDDGEGDGDNEVDTGDHEVDRGHHEEDGRGQEGGEDNDEENGEDLEGHSPGFRRNAGRWSIPDLGPECETCVTWSSRSECQKCSRWSLEPECLRCFILSPRPSCRSCISRWKEMMLSDSENQLSTGLYRSPNTWGYPGYQNDCKGCFTFSSRPDCLSCTRLGQPECQKCIIWSQRPSCQSCISRWKVLWQQGQKLNGLPGSYRSFGRFGCNRNCQRFFRPPCIGCCQMSNRLGCRRASYQYGYSGYGRRGYWRPGCSGCGRRAIYQSGCWGCGRRAYFQSGYSGCCRRANCQSGYSGCGRRATCQYGCGRRAYSQFGYSGCGLRASCRSGCWGCGRRAHFQSGYSGCCRRASYQFGYSGYGSRSCCGRCGFRSCCNRCGSRNARPIFRSQGSGGTECKGPECMHGPNGQKFPAPRPSSPPYSPQPAPPGISGSGPGPDYF